MTRHAAIEFTYNLLTCTVAVAERLRCCNDMLLSESELKKDISQILLTIPS